MSGDALGSARRGHYIRPLFGPPQIDIVTQVLHENSLPGTSAGPSMLRVWARELRLHHWSKNLLVLVPALLAYRSSLWSDLARSAVGVAAFCVTASAMYLINDVFDRPYDREHPRKRTRPVAAGLISSGAALRVAVVLIAAGLGLSWWLGQGFLVTIVAYSVITLAYSGFLKRRPGADVITLAILYVLRIVGGGAAAHRELSTWFIAFSVFLFTSLGFAKRTSEIASLASDDSDPAGRGYRRSDLGVLVALGAAAAYTAIVVFALYIHSTEVRQLYVRPDLLWAAALALMGWVSRIWLIAHRGELGDDPVDFAIRDRVSIGLAAVCVLAAVAARV